MEKNTNPVKFHTITQRADQRREYSFATVLTNFCKKNNVLGIQFSSAATGATVYLSALIEYQELTEPE